MSLEEENAALRAALSTLVEKLWDSYFTVYREGMDVTDIVGHLLEPREEHS